MCHLSVMEFGKNNLTRDEIQNKRILEVGSYNVNGTFRHFIMDMKPSEYIGVDIAKGDCVDIVDSAENLVSRFGKESFDIVISTEMLEHVKNWRNVISNIKNVCKNGGIILITTRSKGKEKHEFPGDYWRYETEDMAYIFSDCKIKKIEKDIGEPGVLIKAIKDSHFVENDLNNYGLYSIMDNKIDINNGGYVNKRYLEYNISMNIEEWLRYHQDNLHYIKYKQSIMQKNPFDLIIYEEIISCIKPTIVINVGGGHGGFVLWLRDHGLAAGANLKIITIDTNPGTARNISNFGADKNLVSITGDCNSPDVIKQVRQLTTNKDIVMVIEDSAHTFDHTLKVLDNYKDIVTVGSYFIVEDGICDILNIGSIPGPLRAIETWIVKNDNYTIDRSKERYIMTYNPKGYLKRIR